MESGLNSYIEQRLGKEPVRTQFAEPIFQGIWSPDETKHIVQKLDDIYRTLSDHSTLVQLFKRAKPSYYIVDLPISGREMILDENQAREIADVTRIKGYILESNAFYIAQRDSLDPLAIIEVEYSKHYAKAGECRLIVSHPSELLLKSNNEFQIVEQERKEAKRIAQNLSLIAMMETPLPDEIAHRTDFASHSFFTLNPSAEQWKDFLKNEFAQFEIVSLTSHNHGIFETILEAIEARSYSVLFTTSDKTILKEDIDVERDALTSIRFQLKSIGPLFDKTYTTKHGGRLRIEGFLQPTIIRTLSETSIEFIGHVRTSNGLPE